MDDNNLPADIEPATSQADEWKNYVRIDNPSEPKVYRITRECTIVTSLDGVGLGSTYIELEDGTRIEVSHAISGIEVISEVGRVARVKMHFLALPMKVRALGLVEITDRDLPLAVD